MEVLGGERELPSNVTLGASTWCLLAGDSYDTTNTHAAKMLIRSCTALLLAASTAYALKDAYPFVLLSTEA